MNMNMFSPAIYGENWFEGNKLLFARPVDIYVNYFQNCYQFNDNYKVLLAFSEPPGFRDNNELIISHKHLFDLILTYDETILLNCKNAIKFLYGTSWVDKNDDKFNTSEKEFKVSFICGNKMSLPGHLLRLKVWKRQKEINIPKVFWISNRGYVEPVDNNPVYPVSLSWNKIQLFDKFQFHIAIENSQHKNYFTEKLCDCFRSKTIPIYWGCPNIEDYFDASGIITFKDEHELIRICNNLTPDIYFENQKSILNNESIVEKFCENANVRLQDIISFFLSKT
jgi:hypothetical protein